MIPPSGSGRSAPLPAPAWQYAGDFPESGRFRALPPCRLDAARSVRIERALSNRPSLGAPSRLLGPEMNHANHAPAAQCLQKVFAVGARGCFPPRPFTDSLTRKLPHGFHQEATQVENQPTQTQEADEAQPP